MEGFLTKARVSMQMSAEGTVAINGKNDCFASRNPETSLTPDSCARYD